MTFCKVINEILLAVIEHMQWNWVHYRVALFFQELQALQL